MILKQHVPWWGKIGAKLILSRLPVDYRLWQRLGLFRHGQMDTVHYARGVFDLHVERAGLTGALAGKVILELGPGDSLATAIIARAHGARAILVDAGPFARLDLDVYRALASSLASDGLRAPDIAGASTLQGVLEACDAEYLTRGLESLRQLPAESVDLIYSQAVLEHVRKQEFLDTQRELARILRPQGVCSHRVDLRDHIGGGLNNLRFSERVWESEFFARSGFYTNRIGFPAMLELFRQAGFELELGDVERWSELPIERRSLAPEFRGLPTDALDVSSFEVLLRRQAPGQA